MDGFSRMVALLKADHVLDHSSAGSNPSVLRALRVVISSPSDELQYGIDESYKLTVPSFHNPAHVHLQAETVYGALHGLQTFSQLCHFNFISRMIEIYKSPWTITDGPRFFYRGLMIECASLAHVDTQSFPVEIPSYPNLWGGAYSASERYTIADATEIVRQVLFPVIPTDEN